MVCGLAWRCCIKRWVKKRSSSGAKLAGLIMADPPSTVRADAWPHASAPGMRSDTTAYPRRAHVRDRRTAQAEGAEDPGQTDTSARACWSRIDVSCHADGVRDCRSDHADRSAETGHRRFGEPLRRPDDCPSSRRTDRKTPDDQPNGGFA